MHWMICDSLRWPLRIHVFSPCTCSKVKSFSPLSGAKKWTNASSEWIEVFQHCFCEYHRLKHLHIVATRSIALFSWWLQNICMWMFGDFSLLACLFSCLSSKQKSRFAMSYAKKGTKPGSTRIPSNSSLIWLRPPRIGCPHTSRSETL